MASQTSPGATRSSTVSASRAKANITITTPANGSTWLTTTRLRHSMRRSFAATSRAMRSTAHAGLRGPVAGVLESGSRSRRPTSCTWPAMTSTASRGQRAGPLELVAGDDDRGARRPRPGAAWRRARRDRRRRARRAARRAATAGPRRATRQASAVRRFCPADSRRTGTSASRPARPRRSHRGVDLGGGGTDGGAPEAHVLGDGQVEVQPVAVAEQADAPADVLADRWRGRSPSTRAGAPGERHQPGAQAQQRGLAGAVRAPQQHDLARRSTRSVAPASAGKLPSTATASSSSTTGMDDTLGRTSPSTPAPRPGADPRR